MHFCATSATPYKIDARYCNWQRFPRRRQQARQTQQRILTEQQSWQTYSHDLLTNLLPCYTNLLSGMGLISFIEVRAHIFTCVHIVYGYFTRAHLWSSIHWCQYIGVFLIQHLQTVLLRNHRDNNLWPWIIKSWPPLTIWHGHAIVMPSGTERKRDSVCTWSWSRFSDALPIYHRNKNEWAPLAQKTCNKQTLALIVCLRCCVLMPSHSWSGTSIPTSSIQYCQGWHQVSSAVLGVCGVMVACCFGSHSQ